MQEHHGKVWWTELNTRSPDKAIAYYKQIFGWEFEGAPMPGGTYSVSYTHLTLPTIYSV